MKTYNLMSPKTWIFWKGSILVSRSSPPIILVFLVDWTTYGSLGELSRRRSLTPCTRRARHKRSLLKRPAVVRGLYPSTLVESQGSQAVMVLGTLSPAGVGARRFIRSEVSAAVCRPILETSLLLTSFMEMLISFSSRIWCLLDFFVTFKSSETPNVGFSFAVSYKGNTSLCV